MRKSEKQWKMWEKSEKFEKKVRRVRKSNMCEKKVRELWEKMRNERKSKMCEKKWEKCEKKWDVWEKSEKCEKEKYEQMWAWEKSLTNYFHTKMLIYSRILISEKQWEVVRSSGKFKELFSDRQENILGI